MPLRCVVLGVALVVAAACAREEGKADGPEVAALKARVAALETANAALEKEASAPKAEAPSPIADAGAPAECAAALAACQELLAKCEKDPFTGPKYLTDAPGKGAALPPAGNP